jgi:hypothetical protein
MPSSAFNEIFKYYWLLGADRHKVLGVKRGDHEIVHNPEWYWRVYKLFAKTNFRAKRILASYCRDHPDILKAWATLRVGCFAKPTGTLEVRVVPSATLR